MIGNLLEPALKAMIDSRDFTGLHNLFEEWPPADVAAMLRDLFAAVRAGAFVHSPTDADCNFCQMKRACGPRAAQRAGLKLANPANQTLAGYRKLQDNG